MSEEYDQSMRFGALGSLCDMIGRMPAAVVLDVTGDDSSVGHVRRGENPGDSPTVDETLEQIEGSVLVYN